ncbi:broad-complex core protein isoforms 1/2/3/4/5-like isoform X1 [Diorhabda carinulata]|uniref:broad-complex core protein isoforms 1/2/3/4/5-like isoform X1 n=1 Tax=Diorhabda carinulata TaxID=1163345 RepID=UPI0025A16A4E|nr:broad-complex core protein isoforms 1/2/3/4/5-like isoform X1 [Diorhabda carinulata]
MTSMDETKQFAVSWSNHMNHVKQAFDNLLNNSDLTDVTLYVEGTKIGAHKMLLSACSNYFNCLFRDFPQEHPIVVLKGVKYVVLKDILKFIYSGEVSVDSSHFDNFLQTAEFLEISGLTGSQHNNDHESDLTNGAPTKTAKTITQKIRKDKMDAQEQVFNNDNIDWDTKISSPIFTDNMCDIQISQGSDELEIDVEKRELSEEELYASTHRDLSSSLTSDNLTCPICFKVFAHPYSLHHHKPVHLGRTKCRICNAVLSRKYNLKMHMKSKHNVG